MAQSKCGECHDADDWEGEDAASLESLIRDIVAGKVKHKRKLELSPAEIANIAPDTHQAYVGSSAFAHKAGLHASAIKVDPELYNHIDPDIVGNDMRVLVTEMAGRASIELKGREFGLDLTGRSAEVGSALKRVKELEAKHGEIVHRKS